MRGILKSDKDNRALEIFGYLKDKNSFQNIEQINGFEFSHLGPFKYTQIFKFGMSLRLPVFR